MKVTRHESENGVCAISPNNFGAFKKWKVPCLSDGPATKAHYYHMKTHTILYTFMSL